MTHFLRSIRQSFLLVLLSIASCAFAQAKLQVTHSDPTVSVHGYAASISLKSAVDEFNGRAQRDAIGKSQPPLTPAEVIAALRALGQDHTAVQRTQYVALQTIAKTGVLPKGAYLRFIPGLIAVDGYDIDVWWIDLQLDLNKYPTDLADQPMHVYRLRTIYVDSRRH